MISAQQQQQANSSAMAKEPTNANGAVDPMARRRARLAYLQRVRPNDPQIKILQQQLNGQSPGVSAQKPITPADAAKQSMIGGAGAYQNILNRFTNFDPNKMQQQYSPVYDKQAQLAQQNVMNQFNQMNREEFARQAQDVEQQIAQRGLDPASPAADYLRRNMQMQQDRSRQEAQMNAINAGYNVQNQMFEQAQQTSMMPYQQWAAISSPYEQGLKNYYDINMLNQQNAFEKWKLQKELSNRLALARMGGGGGANTGNTAMLDQLFLNQFGNQQNGNNQSLGNSLATGVATGLTLGAANAAKG